MRVAVCAVAFLLFHGSASSPALVFAQPPVVSAAASPVASDGEAAFRELPNRLISTRQTAFTIPFSVDDRSGQPVEVQLYISTNGGASWQLYAQKRPHETNFPFHAQHDGEYWFASRTVIAANQNNTKPQLQPELRVLVDTTQPQLDLATLVGPGGDIKAVWRAGDPNLAADSLRLEFQTSPDQPWKPVPIEPANGPRTSLVGEATWLPKTDARVVIVRAEVKDLAGNSTSVTRRVDLPNIAVRPGGRDPLVVGPAGPAGPPGNSPLASTNLRPQQAAAPAGTVWPRDNTPPGFEPAPHAVAQNPSGVWSGSAPSQAFHVGPPASTAQPMPPPVVVSNDPPPGAGMFRAMPGNVFPAVAERVVADRGADRRTAGRLLPDRMAPEPPIGPPESQSTLLEGERLRMTNSKRFRLDYDVDAVGPSGIADVELWATRDQGRNWTRWGTDPDRQSPFEVEVPQEGIYGFRIVIVNNNGMSSRPPQNGDSADIWVGIDITPPVAQLISAAYGEAEHAGQLDIRWQASDQRLTARPITLSFSESTNGPWSVIGAGIPNSGRYYWPIDPRVPRQIFLRLEVRDEAGNTVMHQITEPISTDGLAPKGRIKGVVPAQKSERSANRLPWQR